MSTIEWVLGGVLPWLAWYGMAQQIAAPFFWMCMEKSLEWVHVISAPLGAAPKYKVGTRERPYAR